ncbi:hypothetical protein LCM00_08920 [Bacillus infantis]|uniref:hypothetical protein n=1 Tax=Bacillus infantis TaxID=324767 RepID=UPI001CD58956|nr:hypothetical protein [Bacillus infantis]MCA1039616.1 hypothetical protein [Bacillus infantis]
MRSDRYTSRRTIIWKILFLIIMTAAAVLLIFCYSTSLIKIESPEKDLGQKVVIELPAGKNIYTYEKLLIKENGKLYYRGERNEIDLTGGRIIYEDWD